MEYMRGDQKEAIDEGEPLQLQEAGPVVGQQYCTQKAAQFRLENAIFTKDWTITNSNGDVVFKVQGNLVDWFKAKRELVDSEGKPVVLMEEKKWTWRDTWRAFAPNNPDLPLFTVRKTACCSFKPSLHIFLASNTDQKVPDYTIKGKWLAKKCSVYLGNTQQLVAEVTREASLKNIIIDKSIFHVVVQPGVDTAFIFSVIVIMDKLYIHANANGGGANSGGGP